MVQKKLPRALSKNPKVFNEESTGLMNVPSSIAKLPASGVDMSVGGTIRGSGITGSKKANGRGFKAGKKEARRLTSISGKRASRILRS